MKGGSVFFYTNFLRIHLCVVMKSIMTATATATIYNGPEHSKEGNATSLQRFKKANAEIIAVLELSSEVVIIL